jgi:hypothetical protein
MLRGIRFEIQVYNLNTILMHYQILVEALLIMYIVIRLRLRYHRVNSNLAYSANLFVGGVIPPVAVPPIDIGENVITPLQELRQRNVQRPDQMVLSSLGAVRHPLDLEVGVLGKKSRLSGLSRPLSLWRGGSRTEN